MLSPRFVSPLPWVENSGRPLYRPDVFTYRQKFCVDNRQKEDLVFHLPILLPYLRCAACFPRGVLMTGNYPSI